MNQTIEGVYAATVTPRRPGSQEINQAVFWELIDFLGSNKVNGVVLFGSTGEFLHFSIEERSRVIGLASKRSRVPVVVNVSHSTLDGAVALAEHAMEFGAAGLVLMPPYFFRYTQQEILAFYRAFAAQARLRIPVLLYHIPLFTNPIAVETAAQLISEGPYCGIKDSSGDWDNFVALNSIRAQKPFTFMMGNDGFFVRSKSVGANGVISGIASAVPELLVALNRAVTTNQPELVTRLDARLEQFIAWLDKFPVPVGVKEAVAVRGIKASGNSIPLTEEQNRRVEEFRSWLREWLPTVQKECSHA